MISFTLPLRTRNPLNSRQGWRPVWARGKAHRKAAALKTKTEIKRQLPSGILCPPLVVTLVRIGPREMDDEGCIASLKGVRDGIADALKIDDGDKKKIRWRYDQAKGPYGVGVNINEGEEMPF